MLAKRVAAEAQEARRRAMKDKRKLLAGKAKVVENFLQHAALDNDANAARGARARDQLLELYSKARVVSLRLYNEYESPSMPGLAEEDWEVVKASYTAGVELLHMVATVEGQPLDLRNPWDPPPPAPG